MKQPPKTWKLRGFLARAHVLVLAFQDEDSSVSAYFQPYKPLVPAKTEPEAEQDSGQQVVWLFFLTLRFTFCDYAAAAAAAMAGIMIVAGEQGLLGSGRKISRKYAIWASSWAGRGSIAPKCLPCCSLERRSKISWKERKWCEYMEESYSVLPCTAIYTKARIIRLCIWSRVVPQGLELQRKKRRGMRTQPWRSSSAFSFSILSTGCSFFICVTPILIFSFKYSRLSIVDPSPGLAMTRKWPRNTRSNWCCREILVGKLCLHPSSCHNQMHVATIMLQQMSNICCLDVQLALRCVPFYGCWGLCFVHKEFLYSSSVVFVLYRSSFLWHTACWCKYLSLAMAITTLRYLCWETQLALFITRCRYSDFRLSSHIELLWLILSYTWLSAA